MLDCLELIQSAIYEVAEDYESAGKIKNIADEMKIKLRYTKKGSPASGALRGFCVPAALAAQKLLEDLGKESEIVKATVSRDEKNFESHYFLLIPDKYFENGLNEAGNLVRRGPLTYFTERRSEPMSIFD